MKPPFTNAALARSGNDAFRLLVESVRHFALFLLDSDGLIASWNAGAEQLYGYPASAIIGQPHLLLYGPDETTQQYAMQCLHTAHTQGHAEFSGQHRRQNGADFGAVTTCTLLRAADGATLGFAVQTRELPAVELAAQLSSETNYQQQLLEKTELLRAVAEHTPDAIFVKDLHGRYLLFNTAAAHFVGKPAEAVLGQTDTALFGPADAQLVMENDRQVIATNRAETKEEVLTAAGTTRVYLATKSPYRDAHGKVIGVVGISRDITDRKRADAALRESEARFRSLADHAPVMVWVTEPDGRCSYMNRLWSEFTGRPAEAALGFGWLDPVHPDDRARAKAAFLAANESEGTFRIEYRLQTGDGTYRWCLDSAAPRLSGDGQYLGYIGSVFDIHDRKQALEKLEQSQALLSMASRVGRLGAWSLERATQEVKWSDELLALHELEPGFAPSLDEALKFYPAPVRDLMRSKVEACVEAGEPYAVEVPFVTATGKELWVCIIGEAVRDATGNIVRAQGTFQDISDRKHAEAALLLRDRAIQAVSQGIIICDASQPDLPIIYVSAGFERITGYRFAEAVGQNCRFLQGPDTDPDTKRMIREAIQAGRSCSVEVLNYRKNGTTFWNLMSINPIREGGDTPVYYVGVQTDITDRKSLEAQLRQAQKMEAVGQLAGGIAHDFNNLLTVISGYCDLLLLHNELSSSIQESIKTISDAGDRAAALTRQLLAFSRQTILEPKVLDLNDVIAETGKLLRRLIGEDILFTTVLDPKISRVRVDPGQLNQVLMNLVVNARDAMPTGGKLTIETSNVVISDDYATTHVDCKSGQHVMVALTDTGCGMTPEVKARIFEPFFTTKGVGKGTGLGLAMVFGIVQQSGGSIHVYSEPGQGTTFKIYLPAIAEVSPDAASTLPHARLHGRETILLVEDEEGVRRLAMLSLTMHGYHVLTAHDGQAALNLVQTLTEPLDLLLTDVVMPNLSGPELAAALKARFPHLQVLFMSGYTDDTVIRHGLLAADVAFIQKPYTPLSLARKVRQVLDDKRPPTA